MIYCSCGHFLVESESRRKLDKLRLDALSIPHYVIKKGRCHGARHGKTEAQKQYHIAFNAWKRCRNRTEISTPPSACTGQSSHQLLLWLLSLCIPMRSRSALNCADFPTAGPEVCTAQVLWDSRVRSHDFNEHGPRRHDFPLFLDAEHAPPRDRQIAVPQLLSGPNKRSCHTSRRDSSRPPISRAHCHCSTSN